MKERVSCLWSNRTLYVHLNTIEPNTGQALTALNPEAAQAFHSRARPKNPARNRLSGCCRCGSDYTGHLDVRSHGARDYTCQFALGLLRHPLEIH